MVAVFSDGGPAGKERPHGAVVIAGSVVDLRLLRNDSHAPIGLVILGREPRDVLIRVAGIG